MSRLVLAPVAAVLCALLAGCKSREGSLGKGNDPLVYGPDRIPRQNVPLPERGNAGRDRGDPLLGTPAGRAPRRDDGPGYTDDPARFRGVHIPGPGTTPAALAAGNNDPDALKIDDGPPRIPLRPAGGPTGSPPGGPAGGPTGSPVGSPAGGSLPADPLATPPHSPTAAGGSLPPMPESVPTAGAALEPLHAELDRLGVARSDRQLTQEQGHYLFRATLPWDGARRQYVGAGDTPAAAIRQVIEQIRLDRGPDRP